MTLLRKLYSRRGIVVYFIPMALWMAVIYFFSSHPAQVSNNESNSLLDILNRLGINFYELFGNDIANLLIRKTGHVLEYFMLFMLSFNAFFKSSIKKPVLCGSVLTIMYSITDEIHQLFVPGREGLIRDVLIDSVGIILGVLIIGIRKILK